MSCASIEETICALVYEQLVGDGKKIFPDQSLVDDLGADSLDCVELVMAIEESFSIEISDAESEGIVLVRDIFTVVKNKLDAYRRVRR